MKNEVAEVVKDRLVKILVVEDEVIIARDIQRRLEAIGYEVCALAHTSENAIELAIETLPNLILMDIQLGGDMDGIGVASAIRARMSTPIIYLTSYCDDDTLSRAKITEPFGYILKPFDERELHTTIEMALYRHKLEEELKEANKKIKTLGSLLPICAGCKKIRDDKGHWIQLEQYIKDHSGTEFTHGYCPQCAGVMLGKIKKGD